MKANDFQEWLKTTPEYQTLVFQHGERLFIQRDGEFENLTVRLAYRVWGKQQVNIDQLNNMEACYIEKKKEVEELQDRINEALEDLEYPAAPWDETIASVVKVLRGDNA